MPITVCNIDIIYLLQVIQNDQLQIALYFLRTVRFRNSLPNLNGRGK